MINSDNDILIRLLANYFLQGVWAVILGLLLIYFYKKDRISYLKRWSWSWFALGVYMLFAGFALYGVTQLPYEATIRLISSIISLIGAYLQPLWLIIGSYELIRRKRFGFKREIIFVILAVIIALVTTGLFAFGDEYISERIFLRVGIRSLLIGSTFVGVAIWLLKYFSKEIGIGHKIITVAFLLYGTEQIVYFFLMFILLKGSPVVFTYSIYLGQLDLFLQVIMGVGMVVWLLEDSQSKLEKTYKELDSFLYSTSHDLRSPIASVLGLTHVAKVEAKHKESMQYFDMIEKRIKDLDEIIEDILNYSKVTKMGLKGEEIDFNDLIKEAISSVKFNPGATEIEFIYSSDINNRVSTSYNQIKIIVNNLISNAVKYHDLKKPDPFIKIIFKKSGSKVKIQVADNGSGIEEEDIGKVFDMFYRASTKSEGSGLGLYIASEAANKIGGELSVTSVKGEGTTFTLQFEESDEKVDKI